MKSWIHVQRRYLWTLEKFLFHLANSKDIEWKLPEKTFYGEKIMVFCPLLRSFHVFSLLLNILKYFPSRLSSSHIELHHVLSHVVSSYKKSKQTQKKVVLLNPSIVQKFFYLRQQKSLPFNINTPLEPRKIQFVPNEIQREKSRMDESFCYG